jgi:hypothetical protein
MDLVRIDYTNWRNERSWQVIRPIKLYFGKTPWHLKEQWLLRAIDLSTGAERDFAMSHIHQWGQEESEWDLFSVTKEEMDLGTPNLEQVTGFKKRIKEERVWFKVYAERDGQRYRPATGIDAAALQAAWEMAPDAKLTVYLKKSTG